MTTVRSQPRLVLLGIVLLAVAVGFATLNTAYAAPKHGKFGDPSQPQPASNADFSGHGANKHGIYDSQRDGSPSQNGNGHGNATGRPCAGCVGHADNKNPPGQGQEYPTYDENGRLIQPDKNKGYECDGNNGIGKGNPAHTQCDP